MADVYDIETSTDSASAPQSSDAGNQPPQAEGPSDDQKKAETPDEDVSLDQKGAKMKGKKSSKKK